MRAEVVSQSPFSQPSIILPLCVRRIGIRRHRPPPTVRHRELVHWVLVSDVDASNSCVSLSLVTAWPPQGRPVRHEVSSRSV